MNAVFYLLKDFKNRCRSIALFAFSAFFINFKTIG